MAGTYVQGNLTDFLLDKQKPFHSHTLVVNCHSNIYCFVGQAVRHITWFSVVRLDSRTLKLHFQPSFYGFPLEDLERDVYFSITVNNCPVGNYVLS